MIYLLIFIVVVLVIVFLITQKNKKQEKKAKLQDAISYGEEKNTEEEEVPLTKKEIRYKEIELQLLRAGIPLKAHEYIKLRYISTIIAFLILYLLSKNTMVALLFTVAWWFVPSIAVNFAKEKKKNLFEEQIPPALSLIRNSLEAGMSFTQSLEIVAEEMDPPISEEFARVLHETKIGKDLEVALKNMLHRVNSDELKLVVVAVLIQRQVGGNLGEIIEVILETIKDRVQIKGEIKTLTAQGRLSAMIICGLPVALGAIMYVINPEYMTPMFTTTTGQVMLAFAGFFELLGVYIITRIIKVDF